MNMTLVGIAAIAGIVSVGLVGCSSERSVEAFCGVLVDGRDQYFQATSASSSGTLGDLIDTASALADLQRMWNKLAEVAPEEIRGDAEAVRDAWKQQTDAAVDGNWAGAVVGAIANAGPIGRLDQYARNNCGGLAVDNSFAVDPPTAPSLSMPLPWTVSIEDRQGYTYELTLNSASIAFTEDTVNALPGKTDITYIYDIQGSLLNTTPGHNAPIPTELLLMPIWDSGLTDFCSEWVSKEVAKGYCTLFTQGIEFEAVDGVAQIPVKGQTPIQAVFGRVAHYPEDQVAAAESVFANPAGWVIGWPESSAKNCLVRTSVWFLAETIHTGCI
ncbi:hypothetical protein BH11ACT4_BH11ACT4_24570 [soil metagenome]